MAAKQLFILYAAVSFAMAMVVMVRAESDCVLKKLKECDQDSPKNVVQSLEFNGTCPEEAKRKTKVPVFVIGETYEIKLNFKPLKNATSAETMLQVKFGPFLIPVKVDNPNACANKGLKCPLIRKASYTFTDIFEVKPVPKIYQSMSLTFLWSLVDKNPNSSSSSSSSSDSHPVEDNVNSDSNLIYCIQVPVLLKPANTTTAAPPPPNVLTAAHTAPLDEDHDDDDDDDDEKLPSLDDEEPQFRVVY